MVTVAAVVLVLVLTASALAGNSTSSPDSTKGVVDANKQQASIWLISIFPTLFGNTFRCTGAIIGRNYVITTATCVSTFSKDRFLVSESEKNLDSMNRFDRIEAMDVNKEIDMAILQVSQYFFNESEVSPLVDDPLVTGDKCLVGGWHLGVNEWQEQAVSYMSSEDCKQAYANVPTPHITPTSVCATPELLNGSCTESMGWPLVCNGQLTGLFSWTHYSCDRPGVYSSIEVSMPWITETTSSENPTATVTWVTALAAAMVVYRSI